MAERSVVLRWGAVSLVLGALGIAGFRMAHGDLPAADPAAALEFLSGHGFYTGVHLGAILGVLAWCGGLIALVGTLSDSGARQLARVGTGLMLVGAAIFITDFSIDGVAAPGLAEAWQAAAPGEKGEIVLATRTVFAVLRGTSLTSILILWGVPLVLYGSALLRDGYPKWLGWYGIGLGAVNSVAALALAFDADLFPGVLLYGLLVSLLTPLWGIGFGAVAWRRGLAARLVAAGPA